MAAPDKSAEAILVAWMMEWLHQVNGLSYNAAAIYLAEILAGTKDKSVVTNKTRNIKRQYARKKHLTRNAFDGDKVSIPMFDLALSALLEYLEKQLPKFEQDVLPELKDTRDKNRLHLILSKGIKRRTPLLDAWIAVFPDPNK